MVRKVLKGPALKFFELDTTKYVTRDNVTKNLFSSIDLNTLSSAETTFLRKSGLIKTEEEQILLSPIGVALRDNEITYEEYCLLLASKQWIKVIIPKQDDSYECNLLCYVLSKLLELNGRVEKNSFLDIVQNSALQKFEDRYAGLTLSNMEGFRYFIAALLGSSIIVENENFYELNGETNKFVNMFVSSADKLTYPTKNLEYEAFWNDFKYGIYDILDEQNALILREKYPNLLKYSNNFKNIQQGIVMQKIYFGAPGTGKSHIVELITKSIAPQKKNSVDATVTYQEELKNKLEDYLKANFKKTPSKNDPKGMRTINNYFKFLNAQTSSNLFSQIIGRSLEKITDCFDIAEIEKLYQSFSAGGSLAGFNTNSVPTSAIGAYKDFLKDYILKLPPPARGVNAVFRTTFHPDYDYAQFVGSYKPKKEGGQITYSFVPQVFANAVKAALENPDQPVYLVIEEINRGNCAQIFGDIFQLLDRDENGESCYSINLDSDFAEWLGLKTLRLPKNFNILATMNTSDQSLFPMDSAFKRRFDWEYVPIKYAKAKENENKNPWEFSIVLEDKAKENKLEFNWIDFLKKINADIYTVTQSEDKQMGEFFVKPRDGKTIDLDMFRSKVLFYLWDSVYKDEVDQNKVFHFKYSDNSDNEVTFQSLFGSDDKAIEIIKQMMKNLDAAYESKDGSEFKDFEILQK